ncbi:MAG TPA: DUF4352 domain-containing protein [Dehalococcoidia bacterium]|nr:DUF4352 domain-containing protein [Dehalococcoidia bacterium]
MCESIRGVDAERGASRVEAEPTIGRRFGIGDTYVAARDGWAITVTDAYATTSIPAGHFGKIAQGTFLVLIVEMENIRTEAHALGANRFKLKDDQGRSFEPSAFDEVIGRGVIGSISLGKNVNPGLALTGMLAFDVAPNGSGYWLQVIGGGRIEIGDVIQGELHVAPVQSTDVTKPGRPSDVVERCITAYPGKVDESIRRYCQTLPTPPAVSR